MTSRRISSVSVLVRDYDEAIAWYTRCLGFELVEDEPREDGKRWVLVAPSAQASPSLLLAKAVGPAQQARIGDQTGGRVFLFLHSDNFAKDHERMLAEGVRFLEAPRYESYGSVAVFVDLYGNKWDLLQSAT